jgi:diaminopropionate ammonia-lyase
MILHSLPISHIYFNSKAGTFEVSAAAEVLEFHKKLPFYTATRLVNAPATAARLNVQHVWVKDESSRLSLPAYKILGASWATYRELETRFGPFQPWSNLDELKKQFIGIDITLISATDGNQWFKEKEHKSKLSMERTMMLWLSQLEWQETSV